MLLGDADVETAVGERLGKSVQARRIHHGCRNGYDAVVCTAEPEQLLGERVGPGLSGCSAEGLTGGRVDPANRVETILLMVLGGLEAVALARHTMHQDGPAELLGLLEGALDRCDVVPVDR